jgi:hypothetical protein
MYISRSYLDSVFEFILLSLPEYYEVHCKSKGEFAPVLSLFVTL